MKLAPRRSILCLLLLALLSSPCSRTFAQSAPLDLWPSATQLRIRDKNTLNYSVTARTGYFEVSFDSNNNATWADAGQPYAIHTGGHIRIHGYLASPMVGGPYPAIVIGHGHHGHGSPEEAPRPAGRRPRPDSDPFICFLRKSSPPCQDNSLQP